MLTILLAIAVLQSADQPIVVEPITMASADDWRHIAASDSRAYFVNVGARTVSGRQTGVITASVPLSAAEGQRHLRDHYEIRCASNQYRVIRSIDVEADGQESAFDDTEAAWDAVPDGGLIEGVKMAACGESEVAEGYPSLEAFMASRD